jgi:hypothetical protein
VLPGSVGSSLAMSGGSLAVAGVELMLGPDGTVAPSSSTSTSIKAWDDMAIQALPVRSTLVNGTLSFVSLGVTLHVPVSTYEVRRVLAWAYLPSAGVFAASMTIAGSVSVTRGQAQVTGAPHVAAVLDTIQCSINGTLDLISAAFPGPGFSGNYTVDQGVISLTPDPLVHRGLASTGPTRHLLSWRANPVSSSAQVQQQAAPGPDRVCSMAAGDTCDHPASAGVQDTGLQDCAWTPTDTDTDTDTQHSRAAAKQRQCSSSGTPSSRRALQSAGGTTVVPQMMVQGVLTVSEQGATNPHTAFNAARADDAVWLDILGLVKIFGADGVPSELWPPWTKSGQSVKYYIPVWAYVAIVGGVVMLLAFVLAIWLLLAMCRRNKREEAESTPTLPTAHVDTPEHPGVPWATRSLSKTIHRQPPQHSWWEAGRVTTPPASRGNPDGQLLHHMGSLPTEHNSRSFRTSKRRLPGRVRSEEQLQMPRRPREGAPPRLPGALR